LAALIEQDDIEGERRKRRVAAKNARRQKEAGVLRQSCPGPEGEPGREEPHD